MNITIASSWKDTSVSQFMEIYNLPKDINPKTKSVYVASILSNEDPEIIRDMPIGALDEINKAIKFTDEWPSPKYKPVIRCGDKKNPRRYHLVEFKKMSIGQWADIAEYEKDFGANFNKILSIIYRPKDEHKYIGSIAQLQEDMMSVSVQDVYGAALFFLIFAGELFRITKGYSQEEMMKKMQEMINKKQIPTI